MGISIMGAQLRSVKMERDKGELNFKLSGGYELISSTGAVLAKQSFGDYSDIKIEESRETKELFTKYVASLQKDLDTILGLN